MSRIPSLLALCASVLASPLAQAIQVDSFTPTEVTLGTTVVISGEFSALVALHKNPKVVGLRDDTKQLVKFGVLSVTATTITAVVKKIPSRKTDPAAGKTWTLVVRPPRKAGDPAQAAEPFETVAVELLGTSQDWAMSKGEIDLLIANSGTKKPIVLVGATKAKVLSVVPSGGEPNERLVTVRVPDLATGSYPLAVANGLGPGVSTLELAVLRARTRPGVSATISGRPALESDTAVYSRRIMPGVRAPCDAPPDCGRGFYLALSGTSLEAAGTYSGVEAAVIYDESPGQSQWWSDSETVTITVPAAPHSAAARNVEGIFHGELEPESGAATGHLTVHGVFIAELDSFLD